MIYARVTDMVDRFGERELIQLTDRDDTGEVGTTVLNRAISDATAFVDGYIGKVYQLPLLGCAKPVVTPGATPEYACPTVLTRMVCDLARYYLMPDMVDSKHEASVRYQSAVKDLAAIANGTTQLACPWGGPAGLPLHQDALQEQTVYASFTPRNNVADAYR